MTAVSTAAWMASVTTGHRPRVKFGSTWLLATAVLDSTGEPASGFLNPPAVQPHQAAVTQPDFGMTVQPDMHTYVGAATTSASLDQRLRRHVFGRHRGSHGLHLLIHHNLVSEC